MPVDPRRRQKAIERKTAKRKEKIQALQRSTVVQGPASPTAALRAAPKWPLLECWVTRGWDQTGDLPGLTQIIVAREAPSGKVAAGLFLVDLACLGVKNADARVFASRTEYREELVDTIAARQPLEQADLDLVAKIIREALTYAKSLGFSPHRDYYKAAPLLAGANPEASAAAVPLGYKGKPFFVAGPYDNVRRIIAQLTRAVGEGNFDFMVAAGPVDDLVEGLDLGDADLLPSEKRPLP